MNKNYFLPGIHEITRCVAAAAVLLSVSLPASAGGTLVMATGAPPYTLDPSGDMDRQGMMIALNIYEPLVAFAGRSPDAGFVPALSAEVPTEANGLLSKDGRTYIFPIRKEVKFHDGTPLTAGDAAYSLIRAMITSDYSLFVKPILGLNSMRGKDEAFVVTYADLAKAVKADGDKLVVTLKEPYQPFLSMLASKPFIMSRAWAAANGEWDGTEAAWKRYAGIKIDKSGLRAKANGTGSFRLDTVDLKTGRVTLAKNADYLGAPASLDRLVFAPVVNETTRLSMLEMGDADYADLSRSSLRDLADMKNITVEEGPPSQAVTVFYYKFKVAAQDNPFIGSGRLDGKGVPPDFFSDADVRKGFAYSLDYEKILLEVARYKANRITSPIPRAGAPSVPPYVYDPAKAEEYFKKAFGGRLWDKGFEFSVPYLMGGDLGQQLWEKVAEALQAINPKFVLRPTPRTMEDFIANGEKIGQQIPLGFTTFEPEYPDNYNYAYVMLHSEGPVSRHTGYSNKNIDQLCEEALRTPGDKREKLFARMDKIYAEDAPYILLFSANKFMAFRKGITGTESDNWLYYSGGFMDFSKVNKP
ncbi:MAG: ABC transporter substrate-binding protein [Elusimicrobiota bacterium]|nr:ABC transporter substrate-binding protein [Elusimicrobiota bacterium]